MPIDPSQPTNLNSSVNSTVQASSETVARPTPDSSSRNSSFGPAWVLGERSGDPSAEKKKEKGAAETYTVPLTLPDSPSRTLAALPPLEPLGTRSLTELSLQKVLTGPVHGTGGTPE